MHAVPTPWYLNAVINGGVPASFEHPVAQTPHQPRQNHPPPTENAASARSRRGSKELSPASLGGPTGSNKYWSLGLAARSYSANLHSMGLWEMPRMVTLSLLQYCFPWTTEDRKRWCRRDRRCTTWPTRPDGYYQRRWPRMAAAFGRATCATRRRSATGLQFQAYWGTTRHNGERPSNRSYAEPTSSSHLASAVQRWRNTRPVVDRPAVPIASESTFGVLPVVSIGPQSRVSLHPTHLDGRTLGVEPP